VGTVSASDMAKIIKKMHGRTIPLVLLLGLVATTIVAGTLFNSHEKKSHQADASTATTTLTVLNLAPNWIVNAYESPASSTSTPTNVGTTTQWIAKGHKDSGEGYYLIICNETATPTPVASNPPECKSGAGARWARSPFTASDDFATATRTALITDAESNVWYAFLCDQNSANPMCTPSYRQGNGNFDSSSPFYVNHRPHFNLFRDDSPTNPGSDVTWTASSVDYDVTGNGDQVKLYVCKANDFTGSDCGGGGKYCESAYFSSTPTCTFTLESVKHDANYTSFGYVVDTHGFSATSVGGGAQGTDSVLTVANVQPSINADSIYIINWDGTIGTMSVTSLKAQTVRYRVQYEVRDDNGCKNSAGGQEIKGAYINLYRTDVTQSGCDDPSEFDANKCYVGTSTTIGRWSVVSGQNQDSTGCADDTDNKAEWTSTFTMWYVASPTDGENQVQSQWWDQSWKASVWAVDDNGATSTSIESTASSEMAVLMGMDLNDNTIDYGSLAPNSQRDLNVPTTIAATGNVGLDEDLSGNDMCTKPPYPVCSGSATDTIAVANQKYALSAVSYDDIPSVAIPLSGTPSTFGLHCLKSTSTSTQATAATYWGAKVPVDITKAGVYTGQNTIGMAVSSGQFW
jgi:hypothetical protein